MWAYLMGARNRKQKIEAAVINPHLRGTVQIYMGGSKIEYKHTLYKITYYILCIDCAPLDIGPLIHMLLKYIQCQLNAKSIY